MNWQRQCLSESSTGEIQMIIPPDIPFPDGYDPTNSTPPDRKNPRIYVDEDGLLVLDQEPIRRRAGDTHAIIWRLDMSQPFIFADDSAIVLSGDPLPPDLILRVHGAQRKAFICAYTRTTPAIWKYSVTIINKETSQPLTTLDPSVHQH
jgi:hypothetical protein